MGRLAPPLSGCISLGHVVPLNHEHDVGNVGVLNDAGKRRDNCAVRNADAVTTRVAHAGHVAALDGRGDEALGGLVAGGGDLSAAADAHGEAELVGVHLLAGKGRLVPERGKVPASSGADAHTADAHSAVGIVGDAAVAGGDNRAVVAHRHGQGSRDGNAHAGGRSLAASIAAADAVVGGGQVDGAGGAAAAGRDVVGAGADGEGEHHAEREQHGHGFTQSFGHVNYLQKI